MKWINEKWVSIEITWMLVLAVNAVHAAQSSWSKGSSIETTGKSFTNWWYSSANFSCSINVVGSGVGFLKSKSYFPSLQQFNIVIYVYSFDFWWSSFDLPEEFRGCNIHANTNLTGVTGLFNGRYYQVQR